MKTIIHKPEDIVVGKLYRTVSKAYRETNIYLGGFNNDTHKKFLIIVVDDIRQFYVGKTVVKPNPDYMGLWEAGFEEQDTTH